MLFEISIPKHVVWLSVTRLYCRVTERRIVCAALVFTSTTGVTR
jgi:hypothetical protein